jgi:hypothetical protein
MDVPLPFPTRFFVRLGSDNVSADIKNLADYFVTNNGKNLINVFDLFHIVIYGNKGIFIDRSESIK